MNDELKIIIPLEIDKRKSDDNIKAYLKSMQNNIELKLTIGDSSQQQSQLIKQANNIIDNISVNLKPIKPQFDFEQFNLGLDLSNNNLKAFKDSFEDLKKSFKDSSNKPDFGIFKDLFSQELFDKIKNPVKNMKDLIADLKNLQLTEINPPLKDAQTIIDIYNENIGEVNLAQKIFDNIPEANDEGFCKYLKSLNGSKASFDGYNESIGNTSQALAALTLKTLGFKTVQMAANAAIGMGIGLLINFAVSGITKLVQAHQEAIETSNEITSKFKASQTQTRDTISALSDLESEYNKLSSGVDERGKNIALSTEEYKRYKEIVQQIVDISPEVSKGIDSEGNAIINKNTVLREAIALQEKLNELNSAEYLSNGEKVFEGTANKLKDAQKEINKTKENIFDLFVDTKYSRSGVKQSISPEKAKLISDSLEIDISNLKPDEYLRFFKENQADIIDNLDTIIDKNKQQNVLSAESNEKLKDYNLMLKVQNNDISNIAAERAGYLETFVASSSESEWFDQIQFDYIDEFNEALNNLAKNDSFKSMAELKVATIKLGQEFINIQNEIPTTQINALKKQLDTGVISIEEYDSELKTHINTLNEMADEQQELGKTDIASIIRSIADEWSDVSSGASDAANKTSSYLAILKELNSTEGLSAKTKQDIIINHQNLLDFLSDEQELRKQLIKLISSEEDTQTTAYLQMLMTSEEFFNTKIKGNKEAFDKLQEFYGVDLTRTKDLAEAKLKVESSLLSELTGKWGDYYNAQSDTLNYNYTELRKLEANPGGDAEAGKRAGKLADEILDTYLKYKGIADAFKNITLENIDLPEINLNTDISNKTDENKKLFETLYSNLQHQREMDEKNTQEYYDTLNQLYKEHLAGKSGYIEDERRIALELRKLQRDIVSERIADIEHEILKLEQKDNTEQQRIQLYKNIQDELHKQAEYSRSLGLSDNNDYIQELQKQWLSYADKIKSTEEDLARKLKEIKENALKDEIDILDKRKSSYESVVNAVTASIDKEIKSIEDSKETFTKSIDTKIDKLNEEKDSLSKLQKEYETAFSVVNDTINKQIEQLNKQRSEEEKSWNDKINALKEQNDEIEKQIELEKAQEALERARNQKNTLIYREGIGFEYESNFDEVNKSKEGLDNLNRKLKIEEETKALEELRDNALDIIDGQIKGWEEYQQKWTDIVDSYRKDQDILIAQQILGKNWESDILYQRTDKLGKFANDYANITNKLETEIDKQIADLEREKETQIEVYDTKIKKLNEYKEKWTEIVDNYDLEKDRLYAAQILGADWEKEILDGRLSKFEEFRDNYISILDELARKQEELNNLQNDLPSNKPNYDDSIGAAGSAVGSVVGTVTGGAAGGIIGGAIGNAIGSNIGKVIDSVINKGSSSSNTKSNQQKYLENLADTGDYGQREWAKSQLAQKKYAQGTNFASDGLSIVDELGQEMIVKNPFQGRYTYLENGDGVIPHNITEVLMRLGSNPIDYLKRAIDSIKLPNSIISQPIYETVSIGDIKLYEVQNVDGLANAIISELPNKMLQKIYRK